MNRNHPMRNQLPELEREKIIGLATNSLISSDGIEAVKYLKSSKRHFDDQDISYCIERFKLGYMPENTTNVHGDRHEYAGRLLMPLYDQHNRLVALSSRDWREDAFMPFMHESYIKKNYLYGLNVAKENILKNKNAIVVEGEFDVQYLHSHGFVNAVGCMCTILSLNQIALLTRYCKELFVVFDGDDPGKKSLRKVLETANSYNFSIYGIDIVPVILPPKKDPDDYIYENGADAFLQLLRKARKDKNQTIEEFFK